MAKLPHEAGRDHESAAEDDRRAVHDVPHRLELTLPVLQAAFEVGHGAPGILDVQPHVLARIEVVLELEPAVGPEGDLLAEPVVHRGQRLVDVGHAPLGDLAELFGHQRGGRQGDGSLLLVGSYPGSIEHVLQERPLGLGKRLEVEMRGPACKGGRTIGVHADKLQPLRENLPVARLHLVREQEHQPRLEPIVGWVHEYAAPAQQVRLLFEEQVAHCEHERVAGVHEHGSRKARLVERLERYLLEADTVIPLQNRLALSAVPARDPAVSLVYRCWHVGDLKAAELARVDRAPSCSKAFRKNVRTK